MTPSDHHRQLRDDRILREQQRQRVVDLGCEQAELHARSILLIAEARALCQRALRVMEAPPPSPMLITAVTTTAARHVLDLLLAANLHVNQDYWVDPIPARPPFVVRVSLDLPPTTLALLGALVGTIPDAAVC